MRRIFMILGVVLGVLVAAGVAIFMQASRPTVIEVPVAKEYIPAGTVLHSDMFRVAKMANIDADTKKTWVTVNEWKGADGKMTTSDIRTGFPIAKAQIDPNTPNGVESRLSLALTGTNDYYAVIPVNPDMVGNFVQPGDHVDLILTLKADGFGDGLGDNLYLDSKGSGILQCYTTVPDAFGAVQGFTDRLEATGPGGFGGDQADMAADRQAVVRQLPDGFERAVAIKAVRAGFVERDGPAEEIIGAADFVEIVAGHCEGGGCHFAKTGVQDQGGGDRQDFDPGGGSGCGLVHRLDPQHGVLVFATIGQKVSDGRAFGHYGTSI